MKVDGCVPGRGPKVVFSALDAKAADELEHAFAAAGHVVLSNARSHRMDPLVPLLIPEVNADHLACSPAQRRAKGWPGAIVTNPNCAAVVLAMALAPLRQFGLRRVQVTTMQAVSGAGYPGVPSLDILGNIIPYIGGGEEDKIERETLKILGGDAGRRRYPAIISAQVTRVPVIDGHSMTVSVELDERPAGGRRRGRAASRFAGRPQALELPTAPMPPILVMDARDPAAAAARRRPGRRHDRVGRPRAPVSGSHAQVRRARSQHDSRRRRRVDSQCRADEGGRCSSMIVMKFGGTSVADRAAIERLIAIVRAARQAAIQPESCRLARAHRRRVRARRRDRPAARRRRRSGGRRHRRRARTRARAARSAPRGRRRHRQRPPSATRSSSSSGASSTSSSASPARSACCARSRRAGSTPSPPRARSSAAASSRRR